MTQGYEFHPDEDDFIRINCNELFPSVIALYLGKHYPEHNGGFRSTKSVALRMAYWLNKLKKPIRSEQIKAFMESDAIEKAALAATLPKVKESKKKAGRAASPKKR